MARRGWATLGTWSRAPSSWRYQWLRCSAKGTTCVRITGKHKLCGSCVPIPIGADSQYKLAKKDLGHRLRVKVTAWNGAGRATSTSDLTRIIKR
jgi:hypothetical protein